MNPAYETPDISFLITLKLLQSLLMHPTIPAGCTIEDAFSLIKLSWMTDNWFPIILTLVDVDMFTPYFAKSQTVLLIKLMFWQLSICTAMPRPWCIAILVMLDCRPRLSSNRKAAFNGEPNYEQFCISIWSMKVCPLRMLLKPSTMLLVNIWHPWSSMFSPSIMTFLESNNTLPLISIPEKSYAVELIAP